MNAPRTARERVRAELTAEIKASARAQLVERGASELSLRAVARELGMASSAVYRYFPSRDALLTALIIDAYDSLGDAVEAADAACARDDHAGRWAAILPDRPGLGPRPPPRVRPRLRQPRPRLRRARGHRRPRVADPARHGPGAGRRLGRPDRRRRRDGPGPRPCPPLVAGLDEQLRAGIGGELPAVPPSVLARAFEAWGGLFGLVSLELFGHLVGSVDDPGLLLEQHVADSAALLGLA